MKNLTVILVLGILLSGCVSQPETTTRASEEAGASSSEATSTNQTSVDSTPVRVTVTENGFTPKEVTIKAGQAVVWENNGSSEHWIASAMHPTHTKYCDSTNCGESGSYRNSIACTSEGVVKEGAFDACKGISSGETYSFTFNKTGTWFYHDHFNSSLFGSVIVE